MTAQQHESISVLERAKRAFMNMTSPAGYGADNRLFSSIHMVNIPPILARVTAAYERLYALTAGDSGVNYADGEDAADTVYRGIHDLTRICNTNLHEAQLLAQRAEKKLPWGDLPLYFSRLEQISASLLLLASCHTTVVKTQQDSAFGTMLKRTEVSGEVPEMILAEQEMKLYHLIRDFVRENHSYVTKQRIRFRNLLPHKELERYMKAYEEFVKVYASTGAVETPRKEEKVS